MKLCYESLNERCSFWMCSFIMEYFCFLVTRFSNCQIRELNSILFNPELDPRRSSFYNLTPPVVQWIIMVQGWGWPRVPGAEVLRQPGGGQVQEPGECSQDLGRHCDRTSVLGCLLDGLHPAGEDLRWSETPAEAVRARAGEDIRFAGNNRQLLDPGKTHTSQSLSSPKLFKTSPRVSSL